MSNPVSEAPVRDAPESSETPAASNPAFKVLVRGIHPRISVKKLIDDANSEGVDARFFFSRPTTGTFHRRRLFMVTKSSEENEKAQKFLVEWYKENRPEDTRKPKKAASEAASETAAEAGSEKPEGSAEPAATTSTPATEEASADSEKPAEDAKDRRWRDLEFIELNNSTKRSSGSSNRRKNKAKKEKTDEERDSSSPSKEAGSDSNEDQGAAAGTEKTARRKKQHKKKKSASSTRAKDSESTTPESEATESSEGSSEASGDSKRANRNKRGSKRPVKPRVPMQVVPQPSKIAFRVPAETTVEELIAIMPAFPAVEVSLKHMPRRTFNRSRRVSKLPEYTLAVVDVGEENQQKAMDALKDKEFKGMTLDPKPGRSRVPVETSQGEEGTSKEGSLQVEHVESKEEEAKAAATTTATTESKE